VKLDGVDEFCRSLLLRAKEAKRTWQAQAEVVFTAPYAVHVHEDMEAQHAVGQAKFLEQPIREHGRELKRQVRDAVARGEDFADASLAAAEELLEYAKELCPVRRGFLRDSGSARVVR
jgi:hypothetical protein